MASGHLWWLTDRQRRCCRQTYGACRPPDRSRRSDAAEPTGVAPAIGRQQHASDAMRPLHGLSAELIDSDVITVSAWRWTACATVRGLIPPPYEAHVMAERTLLPRLRQNASARRSWLLDITTDIGVPCVAAVSCMADGFPGSLRLSAPAARPTLKLRLAPPFWKCAKANLLMRSSKRNAASAAKPRSTNGTWFIGGAPP